MTVNPLSLGIAATGILVSLPLFVSGAKDLASKPAPYMVAQPLIWDGKSQRVTQSHVVFGVSNMLAGWRAGVTAESGAQLCSGGVAYGASDYHHMTPQTYTASEWTGDTCPAPLPAKSLLWAEWEYLSEGQTKMTRAECVIGETCKSPKN